MKLDMELIRGIHQDPYKASITEKLLQGYLIAKPGSPPVGGTPHLY